MAVRAPPADRHSVLLPPFIIHFHVRPEHVLSFSSARGNDGPAAMRAWGTRAHTIISLPGRKINLYTGRGLHSRRKPGPGFRFSPPLPDIAPFAKISPILALILRVIFGDQGSSGSDVHAHGKVSRYRLFFKNTRFAANSILQYRIVLLAVSAKM